MEHEGGCDTNSSRSCPKSMGRGLEELEIRGRIEIIDCLNLPQYYHSDSSERICQNFERSNNNDINNKHRSYNLLKNPSFTSSLLISSTHIL